MQISQNRGPLYSQIRDVIRDRILHGIYTKGENIPSEPELEKEFDVSKITVRRAVKELVQEGLLETKSGKGTRVIQNKMSSKLSTGKRFTETLVEQGHKIQKYILDVREVGTQNQEILKRYFGENSLRVERLYYLDDTPYIYYVHYFPIHILDGNFTLLQDQSLYQLLEEQNIVMKSFHDQFDVVKTDEYIADILGLQEKCSLLKRERYAYDEIGKIVEYSIGYYNTAQQKYLINYDTEK